MTKSDRIHANEKPRLTVLLAAPRGFCAGVERAIRIVELALEEYGPPIYVRHEIVHNRHVVDRLRKSGAVFVENLADAPDDRPVIFSAHGVPKSVPAEARRRNMVFVDATCPLVSKVHIEIQHHYRDGCEILLIGHAGHPEVEGAMGQLAPGTVTLIENKDDAREFAPRDSGKLAYVTQTTLSVDDTAAIIQILRDRFPNIRAPHKDDICYATTNRQLAVKAIADEADVIIVVGSPNSSNSQRLVEVAQDVGCTRAFLLDDPAKISKEVLQGARTVGLTAGASAPEELVEDVLDRLRAWFDIDIDEIEVAREDVFFKAPRFMAAVG